MNIDVYIANPYTHEDRAVKEYRYIKACEYVAKLSNEGIVAFSPIVHSHPPAVMFGMPPDWAFWEKIDRVFLSLCNKVHVLMLDGWDKSTGVQAEIGMALSMGKEIVYVEAA